MDGFSEALNEELNILRSIFPDDLVEERSDNGVMLKFQINPDFEHNDNDQSNKARRYCSLQLEIKATRDYPSHSPLVVIKNPRGLNDSRVKSLDAQINSLLSQNAGQPVFYDIIRLAQEFLTKDDISLPTLPCSICLSTFAVTDSIFITVQCHHHFHSRCIGRYAKYCLNETAVDNRILPPSCQNELEEIPCPVCRTSIPLSDLEQLLSYWSVENDPKDASSDDVVCGQSSSSSTRDDDFDWRYLANPIERNFKSLYEKQKSQGGLIDLEQEKKKLLVTDETTITLSENKPSTSGVYNSSKDKQHRHLSSATSQQNEPPNRRQCQDNLQNKKRHRNTFPHNNFSRQRHTFGENNPFRRQKHSYDSKTYDEGGTAQLLNDRVGVECKLTNSKDPKEPDV